MPLDLLKDIVVKCDAIDGAERTRRPAATTPLSERISSCHLHISVATNVLCPDGLVLMESVRRQYADGHATRAFKSTQKILS